MKPKPQGNGSGQFNINVDDKGGWARVYPSRMHDLPDDLPLGLSTILTRWTRERPHLRLRFVVPIVNDGSTCELHAWYEPVPQPEAQGEQRPDA